MENSREEDIEGLKRLLYRNELSQYGKRKLINYYEQQEKAYKRVLKENEELKSKNKTLEELLQGNLYELYKYYKELAGTYQGNCISLQKVKDKIEELKQEKKKYGNCLIEMYEDELVNRDIKILQELLEGRK